MQPSSCAYPAETALLTSLYCAVAWRTICTSVEAGWSCAFVWPTANIGTTLTRLVSSTTREITPSSFRIEIDIVIGFSRFLSEPVFMPGRLLQHEATHPTKRQSAAAPSLPKVFSIANFLN